MTGFRLRSEKPYRPKENELAEDVCAFLLRRGWYPLRQPAGVYRTLDGRRCVTVGFKGLPDYVVMHSFYPAFFIETKRPGESPTDVQQRRAWELRVAYKLAVTTADSVEGLRLWLEEHERHARVRWRERL
ncbi:MAG TPA: hypothetical protein VGF16_16695 [Bryobacteraceae bacterium]|jgi:hypothetical protein